MRAFVKIFTMLLCIVMLVLFAGCSDKPAEPDLGSAPAETPLFKEGEIVNVVITMEDGGKMQLELYPDKAPKTVANFVKLAKEGFYDGLTFHRIIEDFMIQGGDPQGTGMGGADEEIYGEFAMNGFRQNDLSHKRGVISMARAQNPNSASSQFFIVHADSTYLDGQYAAFGMLKEGFDVLDRLAKTPVLMDGQTPVAKPVIKTITVE